MHNWNLCLYKISVEVFSTTVIFVWLLLSDCMVCDCLPLQSALFVLRCTMGRRREKTNSVIALEKFVFMFSFSSVDSFMGTVKKKQKNYVLMVLCIKLFKVPIMFFFVVLAV